MNDALAFTTPFGAFLFGLLGAGHCVAMCGGIAAALAARAPRPTDAWLHSLGRVLGYAAAGALAGGMVALGAAGAAFTFDPQPVAFALRALTALLFLGLGLRLLFELPPWRGLETLGARIWGALLAPLAQRTARADGRLAALGVGLLWGWLPCGLSWTALTLAALSASAGTGANTMLAFGLGTLPAVGFSGWLVGVAPASLRRPAGRRAAGLVLCGLGLWAAWSVFAPVLGYAPHHHH